MPDRQAVPQAKPKPKAKPEPKPKPKPKPKSRPEASPVPTPKGWSADAIPDAPYMEEAGIALLRERLSGVRTYLEYGSGGSSLMAAKANVRRIYSVDTDKQFLQAVRQRLENENVPRRRYVPVYVDIGPTGAWGRPKDDSHAALWPRYCGEPWRKLRRAGEEPELILIDGRFRVAAFLMSILMAKPGCIILFDDYFIRPYYHIIEHYLKPTWQAGRMAEFIVQPLAERDQALIDMMAYSTDSR
ncbi:class I SAM-dependent methyltransferase [Bordetella sp. BOR01]|uniref:class I SAM-dependent methyltransferase n=1 Tax=Bordetella sp. BOR01 TaxID=2854779 RepID=UPI001C459D16|nr:class I SAM-dependent methyltransferase [Bordetella sp. BOR01]MBV7486221.1 class I SAM-dependent methyltransferase [Bordetella sp. BOR01]